MAEKLTLNIDDNTGPALDKLRAGLAKVDKQAEKTGKSFDGYTKSQAKSVEGAQYFGRILGQVSPALGFFGEQLTKQLPTLGAWGAAMAVNAIGVGTITAIVGAGITIWKEFSKRTQEATDWAKGFAAAGLDLAEALRLVNAQAAAALRSDSKEMARTAGMRLVGQQPRILQENWVIDQKRLSTLSEIAEVYEEQSKKITSITQATNLYARAIQEAAEAADQGLLTDREQEQVAIRLAAYWKKVLEIRQQTVKVEEFFREEQKKNALVKDQRAFDDRMRDIANLASADQGRGGVAVDEAKLLDAERNKAGWKRLEIEEQLKDLAQDGLLTDERRTELQNAILQAKNQEESITRKIADVEQKRLEAVRAQFAAARQARLEALQQQKEGRAALAKQVPAGGFELNARDRRKLRGETKNLEKMAMQEQLEKARLRAGEASRKLAGQEGMTDEEREKEQNTIDRRLRMQEKGIRERKRKGGFHDEAEAGAARGLQEKELEKAFNKGKIDEEQLKVAKEALDQQANQQQEQKKTNEILQSVQGILQKISEQGETTASGLARGLRQQAGRGR